MKRVMEPVRKSLLDVVKKNLRAAARITYTTRIVYIGRYVGLPSDLEETMESIIKDLQADYANAFITGLLLVYPEHYIHVLEASEDIIYRHLKILHENKSEKFDLGRLIFLPSYHHVYQRFFTEWFHLFTTPPTSLETLESYKLDDIKKQMSDCLTKVYRLCDNITNTIRDQSISMKDVVNNLNDKFFRLFPESTVIEYLLNAKSPVILSIEKYLEMHATVPFINLYQDSIWPPPHDFMFGSGCNMDVRRNTDSTRAKRVSRTYHR